MVLPGRGACHPEVRATLCRSQPSAVWPRRWSSGTCHAPWQSSSSTCGPYWTHTPKRTPTSRWAVACLSAHFRVVVAHQFKLLLKLDVGKATMKFFVTSSRYTLGTLCVCVLSA